MIDIFLVVSVVVGGVDRTRGVRSGAAPGSATVRLRTILIAIVIIMGVPEEMFVFVLGGVLFL